MDLLNETRSLIHTGKLPRQPDIGFDNYCSCQLFTGWWTWIIDTRIWARRTDHVFEVKIVTADESIRTINAFQDHELFWAVRGGGAGSWGIITSMTIQTYPVIGIGASLLYKNELVNSGIVSVLVPFEAQYALNFYLPTTTSHISTLYPIFSELLTLSSNYGVVSNTISATILEGIHGANDPLTALGTASSYQNEGDAFEVNWQQVFFGYKYANLSSIKQSTILETSSPLTRSVPFWTSILGDEFDVFMHAINRRIGMKMMIDIANAI
ncbi:hypothetical protein EDD22DRAFT_1019923 [Suillus occidentalis]|nr:hypothetical protein EDD22DRAFT_1019923 [Suillus occidentalis]